MPTARDYKMLIENAAVSNRNLLDLHLQFAELITDLNKRVHTCGFRAMANGIPG